MKNRIALGSVLVLALGTAVAGTFIYGQPHVDAARYEPIAPESVDPSPETIAQWKADAVASNFVLPKVPI